MVSAEYFSRLHLFAWGYSPNVHYSPCILGIPSLSVALISMCIAPERSAQLFFENFVSDLLFVNLIDSLIALCEYF